MVVRAILANAIRTTQEISSFINCNRDYHQGVSTAIQVNGQHC